ncbi:MAG: AAA family ATPase [Bacteroides sp.]|nr:AAA family ATPase [Bacteroides sp.]
MAEPVCIFATENGTKGQLHKMLYLEQFLFPDQETEEQFINPPGGINPDMIGYYSEIYPFCQTTRLGLFSMDFEPITLLCGGNGSGKSTVLNIIARKLNADRSSRYNTTRHMESFVDLCHYTAAPSLSGEEVFGGNRQKQVFDISSICHVITSDDIFQGMQEFRLKNEQRLHKSKFMLNDYGRARLSNPVINPDHPRHINLETGYGLKEYSAVVEMRKKSFNRYLQDTIGKIERGFSNGETALMRLSEQLEDPGIYILDEPENSMSCEFQMQLAQLIEYFGHSGNCQFIIATHSPFLMAMEGAKVYDFDHCPVDVVKWYETENARLYYDFFKIHRDKF